MRAPAAMAILVLAASGASAQTAKLEDRVAAMPSASLAVGADGVLRPVNPPDQQPQVIGAPPLPGGSLTPGAGSSPKNIDHPCPGAPALSRDAARDLVKRIAIDENFFPDFVQSVAGIESAFVSNAFSGRAYGLMQICDPADNVLGGVRYLRHLHARFRNPFYILAAYHAGEQALIDGNGLPTTPETLAYIARVMDDFYDWPTIADGTRAAETEAAAPRDRTTVERPQRVGATTASLPRDRQRARGGSPSAEPGPVDWKSGFVASFD